VHISGRGRPMAFETLDAGRTLEIRRTLKAPRASLWRCWTEPELLKQWYCPKPWRVTEARIDLRPGGEMYAMMQGPDGEQSAFPAVLMEIVPMTRLVFGDVVAPGFHPRKDPFMVGYIEFSDATGGGTHIRYGARHADKETADRHIEMGFDEGWNVCVDQLDALAQSLAPQPALVHKVRTCLWMDSGGEKAAAFYCSLLPDSYVEGAYIESPSGAPYLVDFVLAGTPYQILSAGPHFKLSEACSISVLTKDQAETDRLWNALTADGGAESMCGWLKDKFGVSWQIVPEALIRAQTHPDKAASARARDAMLKMKKIDIAAIDAAFAGK
jgi:predicted 3-demethylubiquinone-9 3-methyltransferase (glyoxalase superfamily)/uncharacterized protein YndB with AHSA1/START domain